MSTTAEQIDDTPAQPPKGMTEEALLDLMRIFKAKVDAKDRKYHLKSYENCFVGSEAVDVMVKEFAIKARSEAVNLGRCFMERGLFYHVLNEHTFKDKFLFYRFNADLEDLFPFGLTKNETDKITPDVLLDKAVPTVDQLMEFLEVAPKNDSHNLHLVQNCHPPQWVNPKPAEDFVYNMVVLGAGVTGLVTAAASAGLGAKVALIESHLMGGDCLNVGCVPSKTFIKAGKVAHIAKKHAADFGIDIPTVNVNFAKIMERVRKVRAGISHHDSAQRFQNELGVDVYMGKAVFTAKDVVQVGDRVLRFKKAVIATGGKAMVPEIEGLKKAGYLTNATVFNLTVQPKTLAVFGTGPIGCELAQTFQRLGTQVHLFNRSERVLSRDDPDAAKVVQDQLASDGINLLLGTKIVKVSKDDNTGVKTIVYEHKNAQQSIIVDEILICLGRVPNIQGIGLDNLGVEYDSTGVKINKYFQTTNANIYAGGDVASNMPQFTHAADFMARSIIRNSLFFGFAKHTDLLIPAATYSQPELSRVGLQEHEAKQQGLKVTVFTKYFKDIDRAICDGETEGFIKILVNQGTDKIVGATIVHSDAGNMISHMVTLMRSEFGLKNLATCIFPYPTVAEAIRKIGDDWNRTRLTPSAKAALSTLLAVRKATI